MPVINPTDAELAEIFSGDRESAETVAKVFVTVDVAASAEDLIDG
jgi:hypothetical protein